MRAKCVQTSGIALRLLCPPLSLYYFAHPTKTAMLCRLRMFKNLVYSQDVLTHRMMVCTAHLWHPPPHHHKEDGASLSLLSITIGKRVTEI